MTSAPETATNEAGSRHRSLWRAAGILVVVLLTIAGVALIFLARGGESAQLQPPAPTAAPTSPYQPDVVTAVGMERSAPVEIVIPRIGVKATVVDVGLNPDGTIEVPSLEEAQLAGWYDLGPSPGEIGNAVVVGHVDSYAMGPAVFFKIGSLRRGDVIEIHREDSSVARFLVDDVGSYPKTDFPTELVYGASVTAGLRLVTCGGVFDRSARSYLNNIVVFATLAP